MPAWHCMRRISLVPMFAERERSSDSSSSANDSIQQTADLASPGTDVPAFYMLLALLGVFAWRIWFTGHVNLIADECSYWTWSRTLDWSYFDNSGMVAYLIRMSTCLFNESTPFTVRFPFLILSGLTTFLIYRVCALLFKNQSQALLSAVALNLTPVALLGGSAAIHDNVLLFSWVLALWAAARFVVSGQGKWFYVMGIAVGLAIQSKYTGILALPVLFIFLLWCSPYRSWLLRKEPWLGVVIALVFTLPIIWWNWRHEWASFYHILFIGSGSESLGKRITDGFGYHLAQLLLVSPLAYVALLVGSAAALGKNIVRPEPREVTLLCFGLPLVFFGVQAFYGHVEANWAFIGYASTAILAVHVIAIRRAQGSSGIWKLFGGRFVKWALILAMGPVLVAVVHAWIGLLPAWVEKRIAKEDRIIWETRGWAGLGKHVGNLAKPDDVIAADSYQLCALLEFNVPGQPRVKYLAPWKRPTQFDVREPSFDNLKGRNILFVSPSPLQPSSEHLKTIYENFSHVEPLISYDIKYHGETIRSIHIYRGQAFDPFQPRRLGPRSLLYKDY